MQEVFLWVKATCDRWGRALGLSVIAGARIWPFLTPTYRPGAGVAVGSKDAPSVEFGGWEWEDGGGQGVTPVLYLGILMGIFIGLFHSVHLYPPEKLYLWGMGNSFQPPKFFTV